ncbi:MAG: dual specificity protein phosphatase family protein [Prochlorococcus marinus CUG1439]|uniref:dual specificity protein phosphatase family protein n=1 Tax=Prochlorococcus sp. MIT 1314 TaxID=3096220 RepID=UPI001B2703E2|nr:dual specificity protein phosphatase [Prochlorococcus sp. MIT 1314]MCR8538811.1 dual specificity protein phosphatase family protein [Prochlorococcus marinus CUG1439]
MSSFKVDWVLVNELAIGKAPTKESHIQLLKNEGIIAILSLCSIKESLTKLDLNRFFIAKRYVLPDHRSGRLPKIDEINETLLYLEELIQKGPVFVHCVAAMERSPLICMSWLVKKHKLSPVEALDYMMQVHKGTSPLAGQLSLLNKIN